MENIKLYDVVKFAYEKGYFKITDESNYGCDGLHCETTGSFKNGFYCFETYKDYMEYSAEEYVKKKGEDYICKSIADTWEEMIEDFPEEIYSYLLDIKTICKNERKIDVYQNTLDYYMNKIEEVFDKEFDKE